MLEVSELTVRYGDAVAVEGLSLTVDNGEWVSLIGPNGAGKTSTIKAILGLVAHEGRVVLDGEMLTGLPPWKRQRFGLGYMPEGRRLFGDMSVEENLRVGAYRIPETRVRENLDRIFDLFPRVKERRDQLARTLSGGEQQMVALGRALMSDPRLLLVDEASLGLMPLNVKAVFEALATIHRQGNAILLVEQNARKALDYAQRAYVLEVGRLQLSGAAEAIRRDPRVIESYLG
jgi:branched-chain amino acid transport system ATP-binding protein